MEEAAQGAHGSAEEYHPHESPPVMTWPLILLAVGSVAAGGFLILGERFEKFLGPVTGVPPEAHGIWSVSGIVLAPLPNLSSGSIPLPQSVGTTTIPNPFRRGYINSFNLMVQQELKGYVLESGYVGARAIRPLVNMNANASAPGTGQAGGLLSTAFGKTYTGTINKEVPFKNNYYDSLQTKVTRRFKGGSTAGFAWTWSKTTDYSDNEDLGALAFPFPAFWEKNRAVAGYDRTHNIEIYGLVRLPFGEGQRWLQSGIGNWLLGGWQINPIISRLSGTPFTITTSSAAALNANGSGQTVDQIGQFHLTGGKPPRTGVTCAQTNPSCHFFDPTAFAAPLITSNANAHYGNTNRNEFRGPSFFNMNLAIIRDIKLTERFSAQLRAEAFGFTNTPHFGNPGAACPAAVGALCSTGSNNFGVITGTAQPGGFFGPDAGNRNIWLAAKLTF